MRAADDPVLNTYPALHALVKRAVERGGFLTLDAEDTGRLFSLMERLWSLKRDIRNDPFRDWAA